MTGDDDDFHRFMATSMGLVTWILSHEYRKTEVARCALVQIHE